MTSSDRNFYAFQLRQIAEVTEHTVVYTWAVVQPTELRKDPLYSKVGKKDPLHFKIG